MTVVRRILRRARQTAASHRPPGRGVLVLGMHRSGTSAATRLVNLMGPATCPAEDMVSGPWNPSGHWESRTLMQFDDALLAQMGCTWWAPPPSGPAYAEAAARMTTRPRAGRREFGRVHEQRPWVWKDPRACLLVPYWRRALGRRVVAVVCVRNPVEVAASLEKRHGVAPAFGLALWERYNRLLLEHLDGMPVLTTRYEDLVSDPEAWTARTGAFLAGTGLGLGPLPAGDAIRAFVQPGLRHGPRTREDVLGAAPASVVELADVMDALVGPSSSFAAPVLPPESPAVEAALALLGPDRAPEFKTPEGTRLPGSPAAGADG